MGKIAIIGGTGFAGRAKAYKTSPTDYGPVELKVLELGGEEVLFVSRHEKKEVPPIVQYHANLQALALEDVDRLYAVSAGGRLGKDCLPGHLVNVDGFFGYNIPFPTFAVPGILLHVGMNPPVSPTLNSILAEAWKDIREKVQEIYAGRAEVEVGFHPQGTYVNIPGPGFSTPEEEEFFRTLKGAAIVGQTLYYEARLAREMGIAFAGIGMITDHSCYPGQPTVNHENEVLGRIGYTSQAAVLLLERAIQLTPKFEEPISHAALKRLDFDQETIKRIELQGHYFLARILARELSSRTKECDLSQLVEVQEQGKVDVSRLLSNFAARRYVLHGLQNQYSGNADRIVGVDARGFPFGVSLADQLELPFSMARRIQGSFEIQGDIIHPGDKTIVIDDSLASGSTAESVCQAIERAGGKIAGIGVVIELEGIGGRERLERQGYEVFSLARCKGK